MRRAEAVLAVAMALALAGCVLRGKQPIAKVVAPPAAPVAKPEPAPPPPPLSTPQTQVQLPPAQPVDPLALAAVQTPEEPAETPVAPRPARRTVGPPAISSQRNEPPPAQPAAAQPTVTEEPLPPIGEIVPPSESKRLQDSADARKREVRQLLEHARSRGLSRREQGVATRIESFVKLSDQAEAKGDMREADALAERAQVLAKDLQGGR